MPKYQIILTVQFSPWSAYTGGAQQSTHNIACELAKKGYLVYVIYTRPWFDKITLPHNLPYKVKWALYPGKRTRRRDYWRNFSMIGVFLLVSTLLLNAKKTIVHSNSEEGALLGILKPFILKFISTVRYPSFPSIIYKKKKSIPDFVNIIINYFRYYLQELTAKYSDQITTPSYWAKVELSSAFRINPQRIVVLNNGVPREFLTIERTHKTAQDGFIVFFGRISPEKGVDVLIKAYGMIPNVKNDLLIIGDGTELENMKSLASKLNLSDRCNFLGWKSHHEIADILKTAKMVCLPSANENFSLAILSSMCVGVPTIATRVGGNSEIITNEKLGLLIEKPDEYLLSEAIQKLISPPLNIEIGENSRRHILNNFTWEKKVKELINLYNINSQQ